jgi:hypothetical protein
MDLEKEQIIDWAISTEATTLKTLKGCIVSGNKTVIL